MVLTELRSQAEKAQLSSLTMESCWVEQADEPRMRLFDSKRGRALEVEFVRVTTTVSRCLSPLRPLLCPLYLVQLMIKTPDLAVLTWIAHRGEISRNMRR